MIIQSSSNIRKVAAGKSRPRFREKIVTVNNEEELQKEKETFMKKYERSGFRWIYCDYQLSCCKIS